MDRRTWVIDVKWPELLENCCPWFQSASKWTHLDTILHLFRELAAVVGVVEAPGEEDDGDLVRRAAPLPLVEHVRQKSFDGFLEVQIAWNGKKSLFCWQLPLWTHPCFFHFPFHPLSSCQTFLASHICTDWLSWLGLGDQVGSTNDHLANRYLPSTLKDWSTMRAELTQ